jgi:hypothetical protein
MAGRDMPSEYLAAPPTFEADHIIAMHRSTDRHRGSSLDADFCYGFAKGCEGLMNGRDQSRELIGRDLIAPNIRGDNFCHEFSVER